jgi:hypothetical protein
VEQVDLSIEVDRLTCQLEPPRSHSPLAYSRRHPWLQEVIGDRHGVLSNSSRSVEVVAWAASMEMERQLERREDGQSLVLCLMETAPSPKPTEKMRRTRNGG